MTKSSKNNEPKECFVLPEPIVPSKRFCPSVNVADISERSTVLAALSFATQQPKGGKKKETRFLTLS